jgi:transcriptional regulator with XRE-family HTH domain
MDYFATNLKLIRSLTGDKQEKFAKRFGKKVSRAMQQSYESGKAEPDVLYLKKLSDLTGFSIKDLTDKELSKDNLRTIEHIIDFVENVENIIPKISIPIDQEEVGEDVLYNKAGIITLMNQVAKLMAKAYVRPVDECKEELEQNMTLLLKDLRAGK